MEEPNGQEWEIEQEGTSEQKDKEVDEIRREEALTRLRRVDKGAENERARAYTSPWSEGGPLRRWTPNDSVCPCGTYGDKAKPRV